MKRDKILREKDRVQRKLWHEAEKTSLNYASVIHQKAQKIMTLYSIKTTAS